MKKILCLFVLLFALMVSGCSTDLYDYDELNDRMDLFDKRLAELENWCKETNTNINSLKTLVESLLMHDVITGVTPVMKNDVLAGYTITFLKADPITIYHGEKGEKGEAGSNGVNGENGQDGEDGKDGQDGLDGYTPVIGVKQDADGVYYWTLDGEWLTDAQGNKVKAQGEKGIDGENGEDGTDGKDGKDAIAPQLKIENNYWYISYDGGKNWTQLDKAIGEDGEKGEDGEDGVDGDAFFDSVDTNNPNYVVFKLIGGTTFQLPTMTAFEALQSQCNVMNNNISALQTVVQALQETDYVVSVTPLMNDAVEIGYTLTFAKSGAVTIYHGKDGQDGQDGAPGTAGTPGKDGYSPQIGVKQHTDGIYYWTLDDNWLTDAQGNKVKAQGEKGDKGDKGETGATGSAGSAGTDGTPGENGITPKLKIDNGFWHVSYDNGETWTKMSEENATSGNNVFKSVTVADGKIMFVLNDDSKLVVPIYQEIGITFDQTNNLSGIAANEVIYIPYTLTNATTSTKVEASSDGNYAVKVNQTEQGKGTIIVTAPSAYVDGHVLVHIDSGLGYSSFHTIKFYHQQMTFVNGLEYNVKPEGEVIAVPLTTNFDYTVSIPTDATQWISLANSRAVETRNETLTFTFEKNNSLYAGRSASVGIIPSNAQEPLYYIRFNQASANFSIEKSRFAAPSGGGEFLANVTSTLGLKFQCDYDWIVPNIVPGETNKYTLSINVLLNGSGAYRTGTVKLYADNGTLLGTVEISQLPVDTDEMNKMIIRISANQANKYTAVLPLTGTVQCEINWGDGSPNEVVTTTLPRHTYVTDEDVAYYDVEISGIVTSLNSTSIEDTYKNAIYEIVNWGKTGLTSMQKAFKGCNNLRIVAADQSEAFENVTDFSYCFQDCIRLQTLYPNLFSYAVNARTFYSSFSGCTGLINLPGSLFANCNKVTDFSHVFADCKALATIPETLFSSCPSVKMFTDSFGGCASLKNIPERLFANNTDVTNFISTFKSTSIEYVPEDLFKNCTKVDDFSSLFYNCKQLTSVPAGLFRNCPDVTSFSQSFYVSSLTIIPVNIFDGNRRVTNFSHVFAQCEISGESPYTIINGEKVHLYERVNYPEYFITPTSYTNALYPYSGGNNWIDADKIPTAWK